MTRRMKMKKAKPVTQAFDDLQKKIEKKRIAREKLKTKKPTPMTIIAPKGHIIKELQPLVQIYVDKVLAEDQDWDHSFFLRMMTFKLSRMRKCLGKGWSADRKKTAEQILEVEEALKRLDEDDYSLKKIDAVHKKYDVKFGTKNENGKCLFATLPRKKNGTFDEKAYGDDMKKARKEADAEILNDLSIAFDGMKKNVLGWWD
jgi:hypothetical protein